MKRMLAIVTLALCLACAAPDPTPATPDARGLVLPPTRDPQLPTLAPTATGTMRPTRTLGPARTATQTIPPLVYTILEEDVYDAPVKTQVILSVLVAGGITEPRLEALLTELYASTKARTGFEHHESPTHIFIYAFTSRERAEPSQWLWIAELAKTRSDSSPTVSINDRQIADLESTPEERFGLTEASRKRVFYELVQAEDRAYDEAQRKYPSDWEKWRELERMLENQYKDQLAARHGLTRAQLDAIGGEGLGKDWPLPP